MPDMAVLDKAFEVLKKAGFPQEALDEAYEVIEDSCDGGSDEEIETETTDTMSPKGKPQPYQGGGDMKEAMMQGMKSLLDKMQNR